MTQPERPTGAEPDTCSARGCQAPAVWELLWNNPKLHTPERRKTWLACAGVLHGYTRLSQKKSYQNNALACK